MDDIGIESAIRGAPAAFGGEAAGMLIPGIDGFVAPFVAGGDTGRFFFAGDRFLGVVFFLDAAGLWRAIAALSIPGIVCWDEAACGSAETIVSVIANAMTDMRDMRRRKLE